MKKYLYFIAVATLALLSCQQEEEFGKEEMKGGSVTFKASIENYTTRGTINSSNGLVWSSGDKIGIYFPSWGDKNQLFNLSSGNGTTQGEFTRDAEGSFSPSDASIAFYPWQGTGSSNNNVYDGGSGPMMYYKLRESYYDYTSGTMLTPLIASISGSDEIHFKHAGAAVKVTINNLPAGSKAIGMNVNGQQIWGSYKINPANAGSDALALDGDAVPANTKIWLNYTNNSSSEWTFIFPVPELTKPKLAFEIWDVNDIKVWSKNLKAQSEDLGRADILVMPAIDITPYSQFDAVATWGVCGSHNSWKSDTQMITDGSLCIAKGVSLAANAEFKVRNNGVWGTAGTDNFGGSNLNTGKSNNASNNEGNIKVTVAGTYDIIFNSSSSNNGEYGAHEIRVVTSKCPYPTSVD